MRRMGENLLWLAKYRETNGFYNMYGFDVGINSSKDYEDEELFMITRNDTNAVREVTSQTCLLRDKFLFYKYLKSNNLPTPKVFAVYKNGKLYDTELNEIDLSFLKDREDFFVKDVGGQCASFVKRVPNYDAFLEIQPELTGKYILQEALTQHKAMSALYPYAVNTLRVVTVNKNDKPYVFSSGLRIGTKYSGNVDNWAVGGLIVGIQGEGFLQEYGFYKPTLGGGKETVHPVTGIKFSDFQIPMYQEALALACRAHEFFYDVRSIGWDIAITPDGPAFLEGNDNWELSLMQACDRGLKKRWEMAISDE